MGATGKGAVEGPMGRMVEGDGAARGLAGRLAAVEAALSALAGGVRTRRVEVVDAAGRPCLVAEAGAGAVELRLVSSDGPGHEDSAVVVYASTAGAGPGRAVGIQLWADGDVVAELEAWPGEDGRWRPRLRIEGPP